MLRSYVLFCAGLPAHACLALQLVSRTDAFFYSLLLFNLCTALGETAVTSFKTSPREQQSRLGMNAAAFFSGPWFIGELIDGHKGACFAFGVFIDGHYLEGSLTYVVGVIQVRKRPS